MINHPNITDKIIGDGEGVRTYKFYANACHEAEAEIDTFLLESGVSVPIPYIILGLPSGRFTVVVQLTNWARLDNQNAYASHFAQRGISTV